MFPLSSATLHAPVPPGGNNEREGPSGTVSVSKACLENATSLSSVVECTTIKTVQSTIDVSKQFGRHFDGIDRG